ncbi:MAG: type II toxin-antitoxin system VapC family toxin [Bacillota bacterium]
MKKIFVDSSFWYALVSRDDANHARAAALAQELQAAGALLFTSDLVLAETQRLLMYRYGIDAGRRFLHEVVAQIDGGFTRLLCVSTDDIRRAAAVMDGFADQDISLTDACSAVLMQKESIPLIAAFDRHFLLLGLEMAP